MFKMNYNSNMIWITTSQHIRFLWIMCAEAARVFPIQFSLFIINEHQYHNVLIFIKSASLAHRRFFYSWLLIGYVVARKRIDFSNWYSNKLQEECDLNHDGTTHQVPLNHVCCGGSCMFNSILNVHHQWTSVSYCRQILQSNLSFLNTDKLYVIQ